MTHNIIGSDTHIYDSVHYKGYLNKTKMSLMMMSSIWSKYGPASLLDYKSVAKPVIKPHELLIRIKATTVCMGDCEMRSLNIGFPFNVFIRLYYGLFKPSKVISLGQEFAGDIEEVGSAVVCGAHLNQSFKVGDRVFGTSGMQMGCHSQYICLNANSNGGTEGVIAKIPTNLTYEEAASFPIGSLESLHFLSLAKLDNTKSVLIVGAGGSIGTIAVQLAKYYGANVTAIDRTTKMNMLLSIGADSVLDYTKDDFSKMDILYDVIFDVAGHTTFKTCQNSLKEDGICLLANPTFMQRISSGKKGSKRIITSLTDYKLEQFNSIVKLFEQGILKPVIDPNKFTLETLKEAHEFVETGQKKGALVVKVN